MIIALCSKTYICLDKDQRVSKLSAKGINHSNLMAINPLQKFWKVLENKSPESGVNKGFRSLHGQVLTYSQEKQCLPYLYCKRLVHDDGIFTSCIPLTLQPMPKIFFCLQTDAEELTADYDLSFKTEGCMFQSIRQGIIYFKQLAHNSGDNEKLLEILLTLDKYKLVKLERKIPGGHLWHVNFFSNLEKLVTTRMIQNPYLYKKLSESGQRFIVNADSLCKIMGCGENHRTVRWCPDAYLRGHNRLGVIYMDMRRMHSPVTGTSSTSK